MTNDPHKTVAIEVLDLQQQAQELKVEVAAIRAAQRQACESLEQCSCRLKQASQAGDTAAAAKVKHSIGLLRIQVDRRNMELSLATDRFNRIIERGTELAAQLGKTGG